MADHGIHGFVRQNPTVDFVPTLLRIIVTIGAGQVKVQNWRRINMPNKSGVVHFRTTVTLTLTLTLTLPNPNPLYSHMVRKRTNPEQVNKS